MRTFKVFLTLRVVGSFSCTRYFYSGWNYQILIVPRLITSFEEWWFARILIRKRRFRRVVGRLIYDNRRQFSIQLWRDGSRKSPTTGNRSWVSVMSTAQFYTLKNKAFYGKYRRNNNLMPTTQYPVKPRGIALFRGNCAYHFRYQSPEPTNANGVHDAGATIDSLLLPSSSSLLVGPLTLDLTVSTWLPCHCVHSHREVLQVQTFREGLLFFSARDETFIH